MTGAEYIDKWFPMCEKHKYGFHVFRYGKPAVKKAKREEEITQ
jgi:hypothetical protein